LSVVGKSRGLTYICDRPPLFDISVPERVVAGFADTTGAGRWSNESILRPYLVPVIPGSCKVEHTIRASSQFLRRSVSCGSQSCRRMDRNGRQSRTPTMSRSGMSRRPMQGQESILSKHAFSQSIATSPFGHIMPKNRHVQSFHKTPSTRMRSIVALPCSLFGVRPSLHGACTACSDTC